MKTIEQLYDTVFYIKEKYKRIGSNKIFLHEVWKTRLNNCKTILGMDIHYDHDGRTDHIDIFPLDINNEETDMVCVEILTKDELIIKDIVE